MLLWAAPGRSTSLDGAGLDARQGRQSRDLRRAGPGAEGGFGGVEGLGRSQVADQDQEAVPGGHPRGEVAAQVGRADAGHLFRVGEATGVRVLTEQAAREGRPGDDRRLGPLQQHLLRLAGPLDLHLPFGEGGLGQQFGDERQVVAQRRGQRRAVQPEVLAVDADVEGGPHPLQGLGHIHAVAVLRARQQRVGQYQLFGLVGVGRPGPGGGQDQPGLDEGDAGLADGQGPQPVAEGALVDRRQLGGPERADLGDGGRNGRAGGDGGSHGHR